MVTMVDEMFDRTYQSGRSDLNDALRAIFWAIAHTVGDSMEVLHRIEWSAPWTDPKELARRA
jgi:hypothetical protein